MGIEDNNWESYFFDDENVLKNKLNIHDAEELKRCEYEIVARKNALLYLSEINGIFDIEHLKSIHKFLFEDIYPFAGEFRKVNMGKDKRASFSDYKYIEIYLEQLLNNINSKLIDKAYSKFFYAEALANMYYNLLEIHPFREGNGRVVREFLRQYVKYNNDINNGYVYELDFSLSDEDKIMFEMATKDKTNGYLVLLFNKMLKQNEIKKVK